MSPPTIAIAGFTGKMARLITASLLSTHPHALIHGIARSPEKVPAAIKTHKNVTTFAASATDPAALRTALRGASVCICCYLGDAALMLDGQKQLIDACIAERVPRYIASDWSLDFRPLALGEHPAKDPMKHVQAYLEEKEREGKIKGVHVLNGAFMEVVWARFTGFVDVERDAFFAWGTGDEKIEVAAMGDVAAWTAGVAVDGGASGFLNFLGDRKSVKELAKLYEDVYGVTPTIENKGTLEELEVAKKAAFEADPGNYNVWRGLFYQLVMLSGKTNLGPLDNKRYPMVEPKNVEAFLKEHTKESVGKSIFFF
ncbi:NAD(P)-binding protein [Mytilinidion resinicola]|uniref:NAD(P)-binding protein n=1 Tax=Mytilinidion resinicola TaxID=574789 RepID=A0A6A6YP12_9PEZI|nr:NAD(P)-binding protein [Mytilinidion resinicola]KAF2810520.1 NAD(P)-binding protein [Mytilinidion resinicola]